MQPDAGLHSADVRQRIQPLDAHAFAEPVRIPELACMLVQDDLGGGASYAHAQDVLLESRKFGIAVHGSDSDGRPRSAKRSAPQLPTRKSPRLHQARISTFFAR